MKSILIATKNKGKLHEYELLLSPYHYLVKSLFDFPELPEIEETEDTFEKNALLKAKFLYQITHLPVIADDSGLMVDALNGEPGVHSKRYSPEGTDEANNQLLVQNLKDKPNTTAKFVAVIAYYINEDEHYLFRGEAKGFIVLTPKGSNGFGYDPYFFDPVIQKTFAELTHEEKNLVSHRAKAFHQMIHFLEGYDETRRL
jgi:XTP/dITP diphosphohydrolase